MFKRRVATNFDLAAPHYDSYAFMQKLAAEQLLTLIANISKPHTVLDVGTGTGHFALLVHECFPSAKITLNDVSECMLSIAQKKISQKTKRYMGDAEVCIFPCAPYDLITANLVLQWFSSPTDGLKNLLRQGKTLALSIPLAGTFSDWRLAHEKLQITRLLHCFPTKQSLLDTLYETKARPIVVTNTSHVFHMSVQEFHRHLKGVGANSSLHPYSISHLRSLIDMFPRGLKVNYEIMNIVVAQGDMSCPSL
jgi:ubiquinone/menaquinone biosynthesis C-methylase UbiE